MTTPTVVCICGSTRFMAEIATAARLETLAGRIVVRPEIDCNAPTLATSPELDRIKRDLDELHRAKIRMAHEVLFVAPGGYLGPSTHAELAYALELGKKVRLEPYDSAFDPGTAAETPAALGGGA